jgi:hypothetical protein
MADQSGRWWQRAIVANLYFEVVSYEDFVPMDEVRRSLRLSQGWVNWLCHVGDLVRASVIEKPRYTTDFGVTRASLEPATGKWQSASVGQRIRLRVMLCLRANFRSGNQRRHRAHNRRC